MSRDTLKKARSPKDDPRPDSSLAVWLRLQKSLAEKNGIALSTLTDDSVIAGDVENDNSICQAMNHSPEYARLCANECENVYGRAVKAGKAIEYRCHAGLDCFALPVSLNKKQVVVLGGRAFTSSSEYSRFLGRYGDLDEVRSGECLNSIRFATARDLREAAELVGSTVEYQVQAATKARATSQVDSSASSDLLDAHLEIIRLSDQLESKNRSIARFYDFLRGVASALDSERGYQAVLAKFSEIIRAERVSLMILNEQSNELALEASLGAGPEGPVRIKLGEGIAGAVLASGTPMLVRDVEIDARVPDQRRSNYKTNSFISFPITLGSRKIGVINLTDRLDGSAYESEDLSLLELMAPHLALIIERTEWHKKAEQYQRMSLTDALTGLPNRRYLEERLFEEVERSKRHNTPLAFMIIDVDGFKSYNDIYGHTNADRVLTMTAQVLRRSVRAIDMSARFAGDEFCIVLPETELEAGARIAERLRKAVSQTEYHSEQGELMGRVSISVGVSSFSAGRQSPLAIIEAADRALYQAKTRGRNCVAVFRDGVAAE